MTAASESQRRILREFANTLEQCPRMREEPSWELLVANISSRLGMNLNLRKQATPRADIIELVRVCARLPHGLELIADELHFLDPLAPEVPVLRRLFDEWLAATSADGIRPNRPTSLTLWGGVPPRNINFTGREELLRQLHDRLEPGVMTAVMPHALRGLGGVGKTQLAAEYAYRHRADFDTIWWIAADDPVQTQSSLVELGRRLGLDMPSDVNVAVSVVMDALEGNPRDGRQVPPNWLLIFDNAAYPQDVLPYLPTGGIGRILITSRNSQWLNLAQPIEVDIFQRAESIELLRRREKDLRDDDAAQLADALGDLPLAIEQAAAWRTETGISAHEHLQLLNEKRLEMLSLPGPLEYQKSVAATWNVSLDRLAESNPAALRVLQVCAFLAPAPIPRTMLNNTTGVPEFDLVVHDQFRLNEAVRDINRYALARVDGRGNSIQLHRLVQAVLISRMSQEEQSVIRHGAHRLLAANDPHAPDSAEKWHHYGYLYPHVIASNAIESHDATVRELVVNVAQFLHFWGEIKASREISQQIYDNWRHHLGMDNVDTLKIGRWLGFMLWTNGEFRHSADFNVTLLAVHRDTLGDDHEDTLDAMGSVAGDRRAQGDFAGALDLSRTIYKRCVERLGDNDPLTLNAAHNLGVSLRLSGVLAEAEERDEITYHRKAKMFGADHPLTLLTHVCLALDQRELGKYVPTGVAFEDIVTRHRAVYGDLNPATFRAILHQAGFRRKAGDYTGAKNAANEAFEGLLSKYGPDHPYTIAARLSRSVNLRLADDLLEAYRLGTDALERYRHVLGEEHPHTLSALTELAVIERLRGEIDEAQRLNQTALYRLRARLGRDHPSTIIAAMNLASDVFALGQPQGARGLDAAIVERAGRVLGSQHPITLAAKANLAQDLRALGRDEGTILRSQVSMQATAELGAEHPLVAAIGNPDARVNCVIDPMPL